MTQGPFGLSIRPDPASHGHLGPLVHIPTPGQQAFSYSSYETPFLAVLGPGRKVESNDPRIALASPSLGAPVPCRAGPAQPWPQPIRDDLELVPPFGQPL